MTVDGFVIVRGVWGYSFYSNTNSLRCTNTVFAIDLARNVVFTKAYGNSVKQKIVFV